MDRLEVGELYQGMRNFTLYKFLNTNARFDLKTEDELKLYPSLQAILVPYRSIRMDEIFMLIREPILGRDGYIYLNGLIRDEKWWMITSRNHLELEDEYIRVP